MSDWAAINAEVQAINDLIMDANQQGLATCFCSYTGSIHVAQFEIYPAGSSWVDGQPAPVAIYSDSVYTNRPEALPQLRYIRMKVWQAIEHLREVAV